MKNQMNKCLTCGKEAHDFEIEEAFDCIPPRDILNFGKYSINKEYREALFVYCPEYTSEEIVGSYLGHNPHFPSERGWLEEREEVE